MTAVLSRWSNESYERTFDHGGVHNGDLTKELEEISLKKKGVQGHFHRLPAAVGLAKGKLSWS